MRRAHVSCFLLALTPIVNAQTPAKPEDSVIHVEAREVDVDVTVTDAKGIPVQGLTKDDFSIADDGKPRIIDSISIMREYPLISGLPSGALHLPTRPATSATSGASGTAALGHSTAIILDEVNTFFETAAEARLNVVSLMKKVPADERIALYIISRNQGLLLLQDYTTNHAALLKAMNSYIPVGLMPGPMGEQVIPPGLPPLIPAMPPPGPEEEAFKWRENSNAARLSFQKLAEELAAIPGRKSVFWVTNAFNPWILHLGKEPKSDPLRALDMEKPAWDKTLTQLNEANVAINAVDSRGLFPGSDPNLGTIAIMKEIADRSGGKAFFNRNDLDDAIAEGIAASRVIYTLRFHLPDDERDNRFHALKVRVDRPGADLFYRQGYYSGPGAKLPDLISGKIEGQELDARASGAETPTLNVAIQLPYFYTGTNRASVHLSADIGPAGLHGQIEVVGIALRADGSEAARFADRVNVDEKNPKQTPWHYEHPFTVAAGTYTFRLELGAGPNDASRKDTPLVVDAWTSSTFGIGAIALSTHAEPLEGPSPTDSLVAGGRQFIPAASNDLQASDHAYLYTEVYEPALSGPNPPAITMQMRITDRESSAIKVDTGMAGIAPYIHPGNPVVPFATAIPIAKLTPGSYRLEVVAKHSTGPEVVARTIDFEVKP